MKTSKLRGGNLTGLLTGKIPPVLPVALRKMLESDQGNEPIRRIWVIRSPIQKIFAKILGAVSNGSIPDSMRRYSYNDLFHLYIKIELSTGKFVVIEKNERVAYYQTVPPGADEETMGPYPVRASMRMFFAAGASVTNGWADLAGYNPSGNSCQQFVAAMLRGNKLYTGALKSFVEQDLIGVLKDSPRTSGLVAKIVTAVGSAEAVFDELGDDVRTVGEFRGKTGLLSSRFDNFSRFG